MTFKRNAGRFNKQITLLQPSTPMRDDMGGVGDATYLPAVDVWAFVTVKNQSRMQVIGDYITADTRFFVIRDISNIFKLDNNWRIKCNGFIYLINNIELIDESVPYYLQITATAINQNGEVI